MKTNRIYAALALGLVFAAGAAAAHGEERSVWERARNGTVRAAKATDAALNKAATRTEQFLGRAADKVGLAKRSKSSAAAKPGPR